MNNALDLCKELEFCRQIKMPCHDFTINNASIFVNYPIKNKFLQIVSTQESRVKTEIHSIFKNHYCNRCVFHHSYRLDYVS